MTNETQQTPAVDQKKLSFGARLKSIREAKGMERKDVAAQLRLTEKKIAMMEYERYPADLPITFIRGYLRAYGLLLQLPEHDIKYATELIKPKPILQQKVRANTLDNMLMVSNSSNFIHFFTFLVILTMAGLVGMWWYTHSSLTNPLIENQSNIPLPNANATKLSVTTPPSTVRQENTPSSLEKNTIHPKPDNESNINNAVFDIDS